MCEVALPECHKETDTLDTLDIECERFKLLVVQKVHILLADLLKVVLSLYLHRLGFYPLAVLDITALCGYLTDIYLGVEVCRKRVTVVAAVAVENINIIDLVKVMLLGIGAEYTGYTGVESASEKCGDARLFKLFSVCPLILVLKLCCVGMLVVCSIDIVCLCFKAGVHYCKVLIRKRNVYDNVGLFLIYKLNKLRNAVCVYLCSRYLSLCTLFLYLLFQRIAL